MTKSPSQLRKDAQAYRQLAVDLGGTVMTEALHESANRLEQLANNVEREFDSLLLANSPIGDNKASLYHSI
jgi:hypothetical protein